MNAPILSITHEGCRVRVVPTHDVTAGVESTGYLLMVNGGVWAYPSRVDALAAARRFVA
jgi:hypothetical protein